MKTFYAKILSVTLLTVISSGYTDAQSRSVGLSSSFSGFALCYEQAVEDDTFLEVSLKAETGEMLQDRALFPGCSASFSWNMTLRSWQSRNNESLDFFVGTGATVGWLEDYRKDMGITVGLKGRAGIRCSFSRNIEISACLSPVIGAHVIVHEDSMTMDFYRYGLLKLIMPEIGIRYCF